MEIDLFPRLPVFAAEQLWEKIRESSYESHALPKFEGVLHAAVTWTATGGSRVDASRLEEIRSRILELARESGFPSPSGDRQKTRFDGQCSRYLIEDAGIPFPEACRRDLWSYFCIILMPDVTAWRFSTTARERWLGGPRNTFEILWRRGYLIGQTRDGLPSGWQYVERLTQDAFVQILDRTGLSAEPRVCRVLAEVWVSLSDELGQKGMEATTRDALKSLLAYRRACNFDVLDRDDLRKLISREFRLAAGVAT